MGNNHRPGQALQTFQIQMTKRSQRVAALRLGKSLAAFAKQVSLMIMRAGYLKSGGPVLEGCFAKC